MRIKKILAVLLSAALALTLFAGCGSKSLLQILLGMLQGQYQNVSFTAGPELEDALRRAVSENDTLDQIDAALEEVLTRTASFDALWNAGAGDHTFDLVYKTGADTQAIARQTYTQWNKVLGGLPAAGRYAADLAIVQADGGWYILLDVSVLGGSNSSSGDHELTEDDLAGQGSHEEVELESGKTYVVTKRLAEVFNGTLTATGDEPATIKIRTSSNDGMFGTIGPKGRIEGINIVFDRDASTMEAVSGALAEKNYGTITDCTLTNTTGHSIKAVSWTGGFVAENYGTIQNCKVELSGSSSKIESVSSGAGGIAGFNADDGTILGCTVTCSNGASIEGQIQAGGIVGCNDGKIQGCIVNLTGTEITAFNHASENIPGAANDGNCYAGGITGLNHGSITGCTVTGSATITAKNDKKMLPQYAGKIYGSNYSSDNAPTGTETNNTCTANITIPTE